MSQWLRYWSRVVRSKVQIHSPTSLEFIYKWEGPTYRSNQVYGMYMVIYFLKKIQKNSQVAYSHHLNKMSHLHKLPCWIEHSHYQARDMSKILTLSTFPSKSHEPWDMKGNFRKFSHWDTSESSMCDLICFNVGNSCSHSNKN